MDWYTVGDWCVYLGLPALLGLAILIDSVLDNRPLIEPKP